MHYKTVFVYILRDLGFKCEDTYTSKLDWTQYDTDWKDNSGWIILLLTRYSLDAMCLIR